MDCLAHTPLFRLYVGKEEEWLYGINKAAEERGIVVQCMWQYIYILFIDNYLI